jgi:hypothetical protein
MSLRSKLTPEQKRQADTKAQQLYHAARKRLKLPRRKAKRQAWKQNTWGRVARQILAAAEPKTPEQERLEALRDEAKQRREQMAKQYKQPTERTA